MEETINNFLAQPYSMYIMAYAIFIFVGLFVGMRFSLIVILLVGAALTFLAQEVWGNSSAGKVVTGLIGLWCFYLFVHKLTHWK